MAGVSSNPGSDTVITNSEVELGNSLAHGIPASGIVRLWVWQSEVVEEYRMYYTPSKTVEKSACVAPNS